MITLGIYLIGVVLSIVLGLRAIGVFGDKVRYSYFDIIHVVVVSVFSWLGAMVFFHGYGKPNPNHPDVI